MSDAVKSVINYRDSLSLVVNKTDVVDEICGMIANGGDLITWCKAQNVRYSDVMVWLNSDKERSRVYALALVARDEWLVQELMNELKNIGLADLRDAYNNDGSLKAPKDWPESLAKAIAGVETDELFEGAGKDREHVGFTKKLKLWPKLDAIKIMLQKVGALIEKKEVLHTFDATTRMQELEERRRAARLVIDVPPELPPAA